MARPAAQKRLQFLHLAWASLLVLTAILAWREPEQRGLLLAILAAAALPVMAGVLGLAKAPEPVLARRLIVIGWLLFAAVGLIFTGGAASPLAIYLAIAPVAALALDDRALALEASVFAIAVFAVIGLSGQWRMLPPPAMTASVTLYGTVLAGLALMAGLAAVSALRAVAEPARAAPAPVLPLALPDLPVEGGHLLLTLSAEGRVRQISGDRMGLDGLKPGAALGAFWPDGKVAMAHNQRGTARLANGALVAWTAERSATGATLLLSESQSAYFASLSHELKTPLGIILGYSDMMTSGLVGALPKPHDEYAAIIHETGQDLLLRVEDVLELARADAGERRLMAEPVDIAAAGRHVLTQLQPMATRRRVGLQVQGEANVWADADARAVAQVWQNLVSNAIKFSDAGGQVTLFADARGPMVCLSVSDKGIGMSPEDVARASEPFQRGGNIAGREGTGLGLAIVRSLTERMGGRMDIYSELGRGTRIDIALPSAKNPDVD